MANLAISSVFPTPPRPVNTTIPSLPAATRSNAPTSAASSGSRLTKLSRGGRTWCGIGALGSGWTVMFPPWNTFPYTVPDTLLDTS